MSDEELNQSYIARAVAAERAAIVAWLRDPATAMGLNAQWASYRKDGQPTAGTQANRGTVFLACLDAANAIERGEHHPKGGIDA